MSYNLTGVEQANNLVELVAGVDTVSGSWFGILLLVSFFVILTVLLLRRFQPAESIFASSFATMIVGFTLVYIAMVNVETVMIFTVIAGIAAVAAYLNNR